MQQATLTIVTEISPRDVGKLRDRLVGLGGERGQSRLPFADIGGVHFARFLISEDPDANATPANGSDPVLPPLLVFSLVFDGTPEEADECLDRVIAAARPDLDAIYASCVDYPGAGTSAKSFREYLRGKNIEPALFYQGSEGVTVKSVEAIGALRQKLGNELDRLMRAGQPLETPVVVTRALRASVPPLDSGLVPTPRARMSKAERAVRKVAWIVVAVLPPAVLFILVPALVGILVVHLFHAPTWVRWAITVAPVLILAAAIRLAESADAKRITKEPDVTQNAHLQQVRDEEDRLLQNALIAQNALTHCAIVKSGWLRFALLRYVFWAIGWRVFFVDRYEGSLGGIPSIHFARWVELDRTRGTARRRLLFLSDYDGSWESYLGEFVDRAARGLTAVWSNTENFPETAWVAGRGATDEQRFKDWTRNRQLATPVWFTAYPDRTLSNVENDVRIAQLLSNAKTADENAALLALL